jgi:type IV secretion system protein VirD4
MTLTVRSRDGLAFVRSILCIDPKGENARVAVQARLQLGPVDVLDPFGVSGVASAAFNPLDGLDEESPELAEDAALLADALVYDPPGQIGEAHWNEEAKALIADVILYVVCHENPQVRNLVTVRELLTAAPDTFAAMLTIMQKSTCAGGLVARAANRHLSKTGREAAGVLSSAQRHTHFLDSRRMAAVLDHSDFRFEDLKAGTCTVFLVLPPDRLNTHSRWLRLLVAQAIGALARSTARPAAPVLLLLDEFAALGRLEPLEQAFGLMAGYGLQLWPILQDLHQLSGVYGERAGTFLSNAGPDPGLQRRRCGYRQLGVALHRFDDHGVSDQRVERVERTGAAAVSANHDQHVHRCPFNQARAVDGR